MDKQFLTEKAVEIISIIFGVGGIGYAIVTRWLDRKKYSQEVREHESIADLKSDEFWKGRYEVLTKEIESKDSWWKERYDALYEEFRSERQLSNEIVSSFRSELNAMREDYDRQREMERQKYENLMASYRQFEEESVKREAEYRSRIQELENLVNSYEKRLSE